MKKVILLIGLVLSVFVIGLVSLNSYSVQDKILDIGFNLQLLAISISDLNFFINQVFKGIYTLFVHFKRNKLQWTFNY